MSEHANGRLLAEWFWTDRWTRSSAFYLPPAPKGIYREMLTQAWARGATLPADLALVQRIIGVTRDEWDQAWPLIERYWKRDGVVLANETQLQIYLDAAARAEKASQHGRRAAQARHLKVLK